MEVLSNIMKTRVQQLTTKHLASTTCQLQVSKRRRGKLKTCKKSKNFTGYTENNKDHWRPGRFVELFASLSFEQALRSSNSGKSVRVIQQSRKTLGIQMKRISEFHGGNADEGLKVEQSLESTVLSECQSAANPSKMGREKIPVQTTENQSRLEQPTDRQVVLKSVYKLEHFNELKLP